MAGVSPVGNLTGVRFGRWCVVAGAQSLGRGPRWECRCDCGTVSVVEQRSLLSGASGSCGCQRHEAQSAIMARLNTRHGCSGTPEYQIWKGIVRRCLNPLRPEFKNYGGRGITICDEWRASFPAFLAHIGRRPTPKHSVDRIDNNGGYAPGNVRWATRPIQRRNARNIRWVAGRPLHEILDESGITRGRFKARVKDGWPEERAATQPVRA